MDLKPLFVFPRWSNKLVLGLLVFLSVFPLYVRGAGGVCVGSGNTECGVHADAAGAVFACVARGAVGH